MATCEGCGAELAPVWKYCIHCGVPTIGSGVPAIRSGAPTIRSGVPAIHSGAPTETVRIPGAIRPEPDAALRVRRLSPFVVGGIGAFLIGIALLVVSIAYMVGALR
jgi:hypothetical protein